MTKYTEEELISYKEEAYVPQPDILEAFNQLIESVKEHAAAELERHKNIKWGNGDTYLDDKGNERPYHHMNRRRGSHSAVKQQAGRKKSVETVVDDDGWATLTKPKKSFGADESEERTKFRESLKEAPNTAIKVRPNNKNLGSSKAVDSRDVIADKPTKTFNAFSALNGDDSDEESDDDE